MRTTAVTALSILVAGCVAQTPPERSPLPDVAEAVEPIVPCSVGLGTGSGVTVSAVLEGSPSDGALLAGDVLVSVDGAPISAFADLRTVLAARSPGDDVVFAIERGEERLEQTLTLAPSEADPERAFMGIEGSTRIVEVPLEDAASTVSGEYVRLIDIGGELYRFDPVQVAIEPVGIPTPDTRWEAADGRLFWVSESGTVVDNEGNELEAPEGADILGILGGVDDDLVVAVTVGPDAPEVDVIRLDLDSGDAMWQRSVAVSGDVPVGIYSTPGSEAIVVAFAGSEEAGVTGHALWNAGDGSDLPTPLDLPRVLGFFDPATVVGVGSAGDVVGVDITDGSTRDLTLPVTVEADSAVQPVGDGRHVLVRTGAQLTRADYGEFAEQREVIRNCALGLMSRAGGDVGAG